MPQLQAAKKALRVNQRRRTVNDQWRRQIRNTTKAVRDAIAEGDTKTAAHAYQKAASTLDRAAKRNIIHSNKADRKKARLKRAVDAIES